MKQLFVLIVCAISIAIYKTNGLNLIEVPRDYIKLDVRSRIYGKYKIKPFRPLRTRQQIEARRKALDMNNKDKANDDYLKEKIKSLIEQTIAGTRREIQSIQEIKKQFNTTAGYKIGFLMYMVKRSRDVMNDLFTVAVNHKADWKALDQLKIFELIVQTNVDTGNLLRQLLDIAMTGQGDRPKNQSGPLQRLRYAL